MTGRVRSPLLHGRLDVLPRDEAAATACDIPRQWFAILIVNAFHVLQHHPLHQLPPALHVYVALMYKDVTRTRPPVCCCDLCQEAEALADIERLDDSHTEGHTVLTCIATIVWRCTCIQVERRRQ